MNEVIQPFQRRFLRAYHSGKFDRLVFSAPRGQGKSWLASRCLADALTPGHKTFKPGTESAFAAASVEQSRIVFRYLRRMLGDSDYRWLDSNQKIGVTHKATGTAARALSSRGHTAMGIVNSNLIVLDEPGAMDPAAGELLRDAIETAKSKPGSPLISVYIGTLAPLRSYWWKELIDGGGPDTYVQALVADPAKWRHVSELRRVNPLVRKFPKEWSKLLRMREQALSDPAAEAVFRSYHLNLHSLDRREALIQSDQWEAVLNRVPPPRVGKPIIGVDMGLSRAWSAAVALWENGRCESIAVCPGNPTIDDQERRDKASRGLYARLVERGLLVPDSEGRREPPPSVLIDLIFDTWGPPARIVADRMKYAGVLDAVRDRCLVEERKVTPDRMTDDITCLRQMTDVNGSLAVESESAKLLTTSLLFARVNTKQGGTVILLDKDGNHNLGRDDCAAALILAAGAWVRAHRQRRTGGTAPTELLWVG
ncbi:MAG: hypothetical protein OXF66_02145 [Gammaproteobacteria bacterium]|nr:hypothetical protein [Gammaproteobacteria bacterium]